MWLMLISDSGACRCLWGGEAFLRSDKKPLPEGRSPRQHGCLLPPRILLSPYGGMWAFVGERCSIADSIAVFAISLNKIIAESAGSPSMSLGHGQ